MRRTAATAVLIVLVAVLAATTARAQLYPEPNRVGIYFDTGATTNWATRPAFHSSTAYLVLTHPTGAGYGITAFECRLALPANAVLMGVQLPPQSINVETLPDLAVGLAVPLPWSSAVVLATITYYASNTAPGSWTLAPVQPYQTIPNAMVFGTEDINRGYAYVMQASHVPAAVVNPDLSFTVDVQPDASQGTWHLSGPGGYVCDARGDSTFIDLPFGSYTITWAANGTWAPPAPATATRTHDQWSGACVFSGAFQQHAQVVITVQPAGLAAPWFLLGPDGFWLQGTGDRTLAGIAPGSYTVMWAPLAPWHTPDPSSATLTAPVGETITFAGVYHTPAAVAGAAEVLRLLPARPNPFNPRTTIRFELPEAASVRLEIFDLAGRRVTTLVAANLPAGPHEATWDGTGRRGGAAPSGNYIARLTAGAQVRSMGMQLLR